MRLRARVISPGRAEGTALVSATPFSFVGGADPASGQVLDPATGCAGERLAGRIFVFPRGKGSTVGSYAVYGLAKRDLGPAALVNERAEAIVATGAILGGVPMVDGVDLVIDGNPAGRMPPRWVRQLTSMGYDPAADGPVAFAVVVDGRSAPPVATIRLALSAALATIDAGCSPDLVSVEVVTPTGLHLEVVRGTPVIGMAKGALEDAPIRVVEGPSQLLPDAPGGSPTVVDPSKSG